MGKRPGVMFYFEVHSCLKRLSDAEKGRLFEAILDYGQYGALPELEGALGVAWDFIQPRIDRDGEQYEELCRRRTDAINARWEREREKKSDTSEYKCIPTTNSNSKPNTNSFSTSISAPKPTPEQQAEFDFNHHRKEVLDRFNAYTGRR